jgi:hypothetical protein
MAFLPMRDHAENAPFTCGGDDPGEERVLLVPLLGKPSSRYLWNCAFTVINPEVVVELLIVTG